MEYVKGKRITKKTIQITLNVTDNDLILLDDLAHCVCTKDNIDHPLEEKYHKFLLKTEKCCWRFIDYIECKNKKLI